MAAKYAPPVVSQMEINSGDVFDERSILPKRDGLYGHVPWVRAVRSFGRSRMAMVHGTQKKEHG